MPLDIVNVHFDCAGSRNLRGLRSRCGAVRIFAHSDHFSGARETSCFGAPKSTFHDRCKGSELLYFELQFSWQAQHFGHGVMIVEEL